MTIQVQMNTLNIQDTNNNKSACQLEIDNAYLKQQNELLTKELSFTRYTINALKNMTNQRDTALNETRQELERALQHIQLLSYTLKQQQRQSLAGIGPQLINDESSEELSEEDEIYEDQRGGRPTMDIMSKLPLRQQPNQIYVHDLQY